MYKKLYFSLFNAVTDAIDQLERQEFQSALTTLELAQRNCEELFIQGDVEGDGPALGIVSD